MVSLSVHVCARVHKLVRAQGFAFVSAGPKKLNDLGVQLIKRKDNQR